MIVEKDETASTNDDARDLALAGAPAGTAVLARRQTRGRGRAGRSFASPEGGLYLSVVLRPRAPPARWGLLPLAAGLCAAEALRSRGFDARVKWPNDVLVQGRKAGGVLVESRLGDAPFAIVGVGINLAVAPVPEATALAEHGPAPQARTLAEDLVARLARASDLLDRGGSGEVVAALRPLCVTLGREVAWDGGVGRAVDVAEDGALVVESGGARSRIGVGDVRLR